jgi:hypothetical protein
MFSKDIVLIYLPKPFLKQPDAQAPLGLMYIAASLERKGVVVDLKNYATYSDDEAIEDLPNAKIFGITITSLEVLQASRFAMLLNILIGIISIVFVLVRENIPFLIF